MVLNGTEAASSRRTSSHGGKNGHGVRNKLFTLSPSNLSAHFFYNSKGNYKQKLQPGKFGEKLGQMGVRTVLLGIFF